MSIVDYFSSIHHFHLFPMLYKTIKVSERTYNNLAEMGTLKDSFDSVIDRLLQGNSAKHGGVQ